MMDLEQISTYSLSSRAHSLTKTPFKEEQVRRLDSHLQDPIQCHHLVISFLHLSCITGLYTVGLINIDDCLREKDESVSQI